MQNKCIRFCLQLGKLNHVGVTEFEKINWLPTSDRFNQIICANVFKFYNKKCPKYMNKIFIVDQNNINTRSSYLRLTQTFRKTTQGQRSLSYIAPSVWNKLPQKIKEVQNLNTFKHNIKSYYLEELKK